MSLCLHFHILQLSYEDKFLEVGLLVKIYKRFAERFLVERLYPFMFLATVLGNLFLHIFPKYVLSIYLIFASLRGKESLILFQNVTIINEPWVSCPHICIYSWNNSFLPSHSSSSPLFLPLPSSFLDSWFFLLHPFVQKIKRSMMWDLSRFFLGIGMK